MVHTAPGGNQPDGAHNASSEADFLQPLLLQGLVPWVVIERWRRFLDDLGRESHIHALVVGDAVLDVAPGATGSIEPHQPLGLQHGRTIPYTERLIALQGSRQRRSR